MNATWTPRRATTALLLIACAVPAIVAGIALHGAARPLPIALVVVAAAGAVWVVHWGLQRLQASVERSRIELEHKIKDRTQALMFVNDELRAHRDELQRADRMKSEFLANMSHELRTPLNSVIGFADLVQLTAHERLTEEERSQLGDIMAAGRHLLTIINDILDLAKIDAGQMRLSIDAIDPEEVTVGAVGMVRAQARQRRIEVRAEVTAQRAIRGDGDRMRQVLLNLLSNAIKFSFDGGVVEVRVADGDGDVVLAVTDRGPGIPPELAQRLFEPFVQGEGALIKRHQGTGLGLAITRKLVEMHGGRVELDSTPGHGSTFRVHVPAAARHESPRPSAIVPAAAPPPSSPSAVAPRPVILVADDHDLNRELARSILERLGYRVAMARDGAEAVEIATRDRPALILMDLAMPVMDGFTATRLLKDDPGLRDIPVVALSALAAKPDESRARASGVDAFLTKPLDRLALERTIGALLAR